MVVLSLNGKPFDRICNLEGEHIKGYMELPGPCDLGILNTEVQLCTDIQRTLAPEGVLNTEVLLNNVGIFCMYLPVFVPVQKTTQKL